MCSLKDSCLKYKYFSALPNRKPWTNRKVQKKSPCSGKAAADSDDEEAEEERKKAKEKVKKGGSMIK